MAEQITIRVGSQERITFTLKSDNQIVDLTNYTTARLVTLKLSGSTLKVYATDDASPLLSFDGDKTTGQLHFDPETDTFANDDGSFACYIIIVHNDTSEYSFLEDEQFTIKINNKYES
ncbi:MAG: hypothetical protein ACW96U_00025 [Candidatus Heimdallarchaeaceae archaeon]|jgi:hypothetical protein